MKQNILAILVGAVGLFVVFRTAHVISELVFHPLGCGYQGGASIEDLNMKVGLCQNVFDRFGWSFSLILSATVWGIVYITVLKKVIFKK